MIKHEHKDHHWRGLPSSHDFASRSEDGERLKERKGERLKERKGERERERERRRERRREMENDVGEILTLVRGRVCRPWRTGWSDWSILTCILNICYFGS